MLIRRSGDQDLVSTAMCICADTVSSEHESVSQVTSPAFTCLYPELWLGHEDRKRLHEFEEKCVQAYFHEKSEGLHGSQINRIRATAERSD